MEEMRNEMIKERVMKEIKEYRRKFGFSEKDPDTNVFSSTEDGRELSYIPR